MSNHPPTPAGPLRRPARRLSALVLLIAAFSGIACRDDSATGPRGRPDPSDPSRPGFLSDSGFVFSNRAHAMLPSQYRLLSSAAEVDRGALRYRVSNAVPLQLKPDDFVVTELGGEQVVRRVLDARTDGDTLLLETGPGYWSDVVRSGTHRVSVPFDGRQPRIVSGAGIVLDPVDFTLPGVRIPDLGLSGAPVNLCAIMDSLSRHPQGICGRDGSQSIGSGIELELEGRLDSLLLKNVNLGVAGDMDVAMQVDGGGLVGGNAPVFFPCNQRALLGCITTPTGAAFITWLRQYAPAVPEASLPPVRVCVPGLPVRTQAGYWDRSGFIPRFVPPVFTTCRVTSVGTLPQVVLPATSTVDVTARPQVTGTLTLRVRGNVKMTAKIPLGPLGLAVGKGGNRISAKASVGLFLLLSLELRESSAEFSIDFDNLSTIVQRWNGETGWSGSAVSEDLAYGLHVVELGPDSLVYRIGILAEASVKLCAGITGCDPEIDPENTAADLVAVEDAALFEGINVSASATIGSLGFIEGVRTLQPLGPPDSSFVMSKVGTVRNEEFLLGANLRIPLSNFFIPSAPIKWDTTFTGEPLPISDAWESVGAYVQLATIGENPDLDGYRLVFERTDTLPRLYREGSERIGAARDHGRRIERAVASNGLAVLQFTTSRNNCTVMYTDVFKPYDPTLGQELDGARVRGRNWPSWFVAYPCPMLAGQYRITVEDVSDNCVVLGGNPQEHWIPGRQLLAGRTGILERTLTVECSVATPTGSVQVTTNLADTAFDPEPYALQVNGNARGSIARNETRIISGVETGAAQISLVGGSGQCIIPAMIEVNVVANALAVVAFDGPCSAPDLPPPPPGTVIVSPEVTGTATDDNGFLAVLDGETIQHVPADGSGSFSGVAGARPTVIELTDVAPSCRPLTPLPMVFDLGTPTGVATLRPQLECTDAAIRTLLGTIERAAGSSGGIALRLATGAVTSLAGTLAAELAQLEGAAVNVWGADAGIALTVHGYSLVSTLNEPRVTGVLLQRDGAYWLFGRRAILLNNPPAALTALAGSYVWVGGTMPSDSAMQPSVFGLLRSAQ